VIGDNSPLSVTGEAAQGREDRRSDGATVHGIFIAIGHAPQTELFTGQLEMKQGGYL
jgi:thioredoxin reductase (NADPH)